ncbi:HutD family protein [Clostridiaceae bacterium M8S5]|nr:HutD family protein [Clostridiaceae bacterium M8S5]
MKKYDIKIIKKKQQITSNWSGGKTTELFIYPPNSNYKQRNFLWRLSSATVNVEKSTFTHLPEIKRVLMVLEGRLKLEHIGHYSVELEEGEQDTFDGDWVTKSFGKVRDFNLMLTHGYTGQVEIMNSTYIDLSTKNGECKTEVIYCLKDDTRIRLKDDDILLNKEDLLIIDIKEGCSNLEASLTNDKEDGIKVIKTTILKGSRD